MRLFRLTLTQTLPYILIIGGLIGCLCAGILSVDKLTLLQHPDTRLGCDINPIVACGSVINTDQASAFGFPNTYIGIAGFAGVAMFGAALLAGGVFKRWLWLGLQLGVTFAAGFATWLQFQTIFRIHALCPYCMLVWTVTIPIFLYTTIYNLQTGKLSLGKRSQGVQAFIIRHHGDILVGWYLVILLIILKQFWYYWKTLV